MARYQSQAKKGYYKTPTHLLPVIASYLTCAAPESVRILDPCAGEGEAVETLGTILGLSHTQIYANELDEPRAHACRERGLVTVCGDGVVELRTVLGGFQCLFINPPYDQEGDGTGRTEYKFLQCVRYLAHNGILVYVVPLGILRDERIIRRLAGGFHDIRVLRFPDDDYAAYGQCVMFARRGRGDTALETHRLLTELANPPVLGDAVGHTWNIPAPTVLALPTFAFFSQNLTEPLITELVATHVARKECAFGLDRQPQRPARSLMPLRSGHQAVTLATGLMDGIFRDPGTGNLLVISGKTEVLETRSDEIDDEGRDVRRIRKTPQAVVTAFDVTASMQAGEIIFYNMR